MAKALLISYPGYPYTPSSLLPDNGLANLAGALIENGHDVFVLDYGTIETMRRLIPANLRQTLGKVYEKVRSDKRGRCSKLLSLFQLRYLDKKLTGYRKREVMCIAAELSRVVRNEKPDFVGFKLWNGDGFDGPVMMAEYLKREFPQLKIFAGGPHVDFFRGLIFEVTRAFDGQVPFLHERRKCP